MRVPLHSTVGCFLGERKSRERERELMGHCKTGINPYSGLPNESTALMRVLPCKKSEIAKSTAFQNDPNKSTA